MTLCSRCRESYDHVTRPSQLGETYRFDHGLPMQRPLRGSTSHLVAGVEQAEENG